MNTNLSRQQRIFNVAAGQMVEELKGRHAYLHGVNFGREEYGVFWLRSTDTTWGHGWGRLIGYDEMFKAHCGQDADEMFGSARFAGWFGHEMDGHDRRSTNWGASHVLASPVIEVADDGKSARGSFITPGVIFCRLNRHQYPYCNVLWERYGSDFVLEHGKWKYLHEQVCPDIMGKLDMTNFAHDDFERLTAPQEQGIGPVTLGEDPDVTDPGPLHLPYSVIMPPQNTVPWPVPYVTLDNDNSFCPVKTFAELQSEQTK